MKINSKNQRDSYYVQTNDLSNRKHLDKPIDLESWMTNLPLYLQKIPLHHIYIPGSHDSFSYGLDRSIVGPDGPSYVSCLAPIPCYIKDIFLRWSQTQKMSVCDQLQHGIRYFDIRVAIKNNKFYFTHLLLGSELPPLLIKMKEFLDDHPREVVVLDFQHFFGFSSEDHLLFMKIISDIFCGAICPYTDSLNSLTLSFMRNSKYQVILIYRNSGIHNNSNFWPNSSLPNPWANTVRLPFLISFLNDNVEKRCERKFFVSQCVLTPSLRYILKNVTNSLERKLAIPCNKEISQWIGSFSSSPRDTFSPNIIMSDFVEENDWEIPRAVVLCNFNLMDNCS